MPPMTQFRTPLRQRPSLPRRSFSLVPLAAALSLPGLARPPGAVAQEAWPTRPVRILVPFPAGSGTDTLARFYSERLSRSLGQPVPVENMGGANSVAGKPNSFCVPCRRNSRAETIRRTARVCGAYGERRSNKKELLYTAPTKRR